jgi:glycosyltransferase involved in cell wall biosynthesis
MKITILEEALEAGHGHWPSYIGGMAHDWRSGGHTVDILAHRHASPDLLAVLGADPVFRRSCWTDTRSQGAWGGLVHNLFFYQDALPRLNQAQPSDWVLSLTTRTQHLLAFAALARRTPRSTRFLLLFVQGFGQFQGEGQPVRFPATPSTHFARLCFRLLAPAVRAGRVHLAAETAAMRDELAHFTGLPVQLFPHPVPPAPVNPQTLPGSPEIFTVCSPGFARHEKGSDLLLATIPALLSGPWGNRLHFILQWPDPFRLPDGTWCSPPEDLRRDRRIEFLDHALDETAYNQLLARCHFLVLPYRLHAYHNRVSRVAIEGAVRGIPLLFTRGSSPSELPLKQEAMVVFENEDTQSLMSGIQDMLENWTQRKVAADDCAQTASDEHSANRFLSILRDWISQ